jgi:hypothetical protein
MPTSITESVSSLAGDLWFFCSFENKVSCPCKRVKENKGFLDSGIAFLIVFLNLNLVVLLALCCRGLVAKHYGFFKTLLIKKMFGENARNCSLELGREFPNFCGN